MFLVIELTFTCIDRNSFEMELVGRRNEQALEKLRVLLETFALECQLCSRSFVDPRVLSCGHSFCFDCIEQLASGSTSCCCRICSKVVELPIQGVSRLRKDLVSATLLEVRDLLHDGATVRCTICDRNRAAHACYTCNALLCARCHNNHEHEQSDRKKHETCAVRQLRDANNLVRFQSSRFGVCAKHLQKNDLFCKFEDLQVCTQCATDDVHSPHVIVPLNVKIDEFFSSLFAKCQQLNGERRSDPIFIKKHFLLFFSGCLVPFFPESSTDINRSLMVLKMKESGLNECVTELTQQIDQRVEQLSR